jgi:hypothetical protein
MRIGVDCYSGYRGEETPRRLLLGARRLEVVDVLDRWLAPDHRYFKVRCDDQGTYIIRHDNRRGIWQLICFDAGCKKDKRSQGTASALLSGT